APASSPVGAAITSPTAAAPASASAIASPAAAAAPSGGPSNVGGTITFAVSSDPDSIDPAIGVAGSHYRVFLQVYEGLLSYKGQTAELGPALAESWTVAPDGTAIELKLRRNVKFHSGALLDADTVKQSIDRIKAVNRGGAFFLQALKEVQVVDPLTVR